MKRPLRTVAYHTLGCKLNFSETSTIARTLSDEGYVKVDFANASDIYVINTCSVTENADRECRAIVNRALKHNPDATVVITGCFAQLKPVQVAEIPGVDLVLGAGEKFNLPKYLNELDFTGDPIVKACDIDELEGFVPTWSENDRTRVFLKVQDGCSYNCSFCTIPLARGRSRSSTINKVLVQISELISRGAKEIVLTGINLGDFGIDPNDLARSESFEELVGAIDSEFKDIRFRISSIEPNLLTNKIIELIAKSDTFMPHFHIPLQSGSDKILGKMRRRYRTDLYSDRINRIIKLMPDAAIGADVIVGFPGETDSDFEETLNYLTKLPVTYLHVFTYSERENTLAAEMDDIIPMGVRKQRNRQLRKLSEMKQELFIQKHYGIEYPVLFESENKNGLISGYTPNYIRLSMPFDSSKVNDVVNCKVGNSSQGNVVQVLSNECETVII